MPIKAGHSWPDWLFNVFWNPPVILFLKVAHTNQTSTGTNGKLVLYFKNHEQLSLEDVCTWITQWGPADTSGGPIDSQ